MLFAAAGIQPEKGRETNISYVRLYGLSKFKLEFRLVETDYEWHYALKYNVNILSL